MIFITKNVKSLYHVVKRRVNTPLPNSIQYFLQNDQNKDISAWSDVDIALQGDNVTIVVEIPNYLSAKTELIKEIPFHPIMQDTRKNKIVNKTELRHYALPLPLINYGFIPMTWEQNIKPDENGMFGDDDPIDIVDLTVKQRKIFDINKAKVLGSFCLIDQGELDWKIITIDPQEAKANQINSVQDISKQRFNEIMEWFKVYKTYDGKPANTIGFNGKIFSKQESLKIIHETHLQFLKLKEGRQEQYAKRKALFHL